MMTMDLMGGYGRADEQAAIQEAAAAGLRGMEHLILRLSQTGTGAESSPAVAAPEQAKGKQQQQQEQVDCREITDMTVSKFKKVISILNRTGHARFRRGPVVAQSQGPEHQQQAPVVVRSSSVTLDFTKAGYGNKDAGLSVSAATASSSFLSSVTGDGSVSNGRAGVSSSMVFPPPPSASCGKPPLAAKHKCHDHAHSENVAGASGGRCHCSKRRKSRVRRMTRVPAISSKAAEIPADDFSWRKYGQKPIKGSPYPRGYYKCSTVRGCPARKHVERDPSEPSMLIVTYEGDHRHAPADQEPPPPPLAALHEL
ncbi:WRKY transcription factor WRKY51 [Brachypodium distachyon]|uniref:WRKY transcription factor WRKY51 n=1 Tax=Brachypodium distachyon TaxID=15368 RepID=I1IWL3_BRADI|nr:WRKY transcription factor WRKY51 [Brachypodium distachyon]KQJ82006.1 hypothetical protein BRADI_5g04817v3 [Brachypodium distachyon]|eukprot:XP_003579385.1 WRKY transcription factor WRKY51 [Brachypodium distachyon]